MARNKYQAYDWHITKHGRLLREIGTQALDIVTVGVLAMIRLQAGQSRQACGMVDGSLAIGAVHRAKRRDVVRWLGHLPGLTPKRAEDAVEALRAAGLVEFTRRGVVVVAQWRVDHEGPPSKDANRQRRCREARDVAEAAAALASLNGATMPLVAVQDHLSDFLRIRTESVSRLCERLTEMGILQPAGAGSVHVVTTVSTNGSRPAGGSPPPPTGDTIRPMPTCDMSRTAGVTCHTESIVDRLKIQSSTSMSTGGGEPPAGRKAAPDQPSELPGDIWSMPPVEAALAVTGFRTRANQAIYGAKLRQIERLLGPDHGRRRFMDVVNKLRTDLRDGGDRFIATADRPRVLTGALRDEIERIQQRKGGGPDGGL